MHVLTGHVRLALRSTRTTLALAAIGGLLLRALLPVEQAWLPGAVAAGAALAALLLIVLQRGAVPQLPDPDAAYERLGATAQVGQALLRAAFVLGAFAAGLALGSLVPLGRA